MNAMNASNTARLRTLRQGGFSLIEILIVVALIAVIVGFATNQIFGGQDKAKANLAKAQIQTLVGKIEQYQLDNGSVPTSLDDLFRQPSGSRTWLGPYAKESDTKDPWGRAFQFAAGGDAGYEIKSLGKDGKPGGDSFNRDISSAD
jgi:general secretion pathway protein G